MTGKTNRNAPPTVRQGGPLPNAAFTRGAYGARTSFPGSSMRTAARVFFLTSMALLVTACSTLGAVSAWFNNQMAFTSPQLQRYVDRRFPRTFDKLGGLVSITLTNPRLSIPAGESRLHLSFDMGIGGLGGLAGSGGTVGHLSLASGLRYDGGTQGLHLDNPELLQFDMPGTGSLLKGGTRGIVNSLLAEYARSEPVYQLEPELLNRLPAGKRIDRVAVDNGLVHVLLN